MNHHAQRLLVAASRGARIYDKLMDVADGPITTLHSIEDCFALYIHHADAHLQYGPIATELRKMAMDDCYCSLPPIWTMAINWLAFVDFLSLQLTDDDVFSWLCLFAAELAADEGM